MARVAVLVLAVLTALLAAAAVWLGGQGRDAQARADDREAALRAASTHAMNLLSLNHETVDADVHRILTSSSGAASAAYEAAADEPVRTTREHKAVQEGAGGAGGLEALSGGRGLALGVGDGASR